MIGKRIRAIATLAAGCAVLVAAPAEAATSAQYGARCGAAWTGKKTTSAYRSFRKRCIKAATAATSAATDVGNPTSKPANRLRSVTACTVQFPLPRKTKAKRKAYNTCVTATNAAQSRYAARPLSSTMKGANVVPQAGKASGRLSLRLNEGAKRVCFTIAASSLGAGAVTRASIRAGAAGRNGKVAVTLGNKISLDAMNHRDTVEGCIAGVSKATIKAILKRPANYYVLVQTTTRPGGAVRGQLRK